MSLLLGLLVQFVALAVVITVAGYYMTKYGDIIAVKTGLGSIWIGVVLIATATSLPELFTGVGSLVIADLPDIAVGDLLGSCIFNLLLIVIADFLYGKQSILGRSSQGHILSAGFGIFMAAIILFALIARNEFADARILHIGVISVFLVGIYFIAMQAIYKFESFRRHEIHDPVELKQSGVTTLSTAIKLYTVSALVVISAALFIPRTAAALAEIAGLSGSFMGTTFVALTTSLPEAVVIISAVRMSLPDLAIASVLGSNLFNLMLLAFDDIIYTKDVLLLVASPAHINSAITILAMYGLVIIGVIYRLQTSKKWRISWESLVILILYFGNTYMLLANG